jgi:UDP-glucose 4-epimerase
MKILITGGCGFIGTNLIKALNAQNLTDIIVIDDLSIGTLSNISELKIKSFHQADILDLESISQVFEGIDIVIHLAASGSVVNSVADPLSNLKINVMGTQNVLHYSMLNKIPKFIQASTGGALIGNASSPINETSLPNPISPYGASKLSCEAYCSAYANSYNMDITALRFANVVGPYGLHKKGVVNTFINNIVRLEPIVIFGNGNSTRDYLHVHDLCDGIIRAAQFQKNGFDVYHLASGVETTILDLAKTISFVMGSPNHPINFVKKRLGEVENNSATFDLAKNTFGFSLKSNLKVALEDTFNFYREFHEK